MVIVMKPQATKKKLQGGKAAAKPNFGVHISEVLSVPL